MSTEALSIDQAVDKLVGEEPAQDTSDIESVVDDVLIQDEPEEDVNSTEEDSDVDNSEEYSEEYDTDDESTEYENEPVQTWTDETVVPIKVDGEDGTATIRELKQAFAGQGKIQRGMQEAAEARKQAEGMPPKGGGLRVGLGGGPGGLLVPTAGRAHAHYRLRRNGGGPERGLRREGGHPAGHGRISIGATHPDDLRRPLQAGLRGYLVYPH